MESNPIEIRDSLVDVDRRGTDQESVSGGNEQRPRD
jgi:hypothetical protein